MEINAYIPYDTIKIQENLNELSNQMVAIISPTDISFL